MSSKMKYTHIRQTSFAIILIYHQNCLKQSPTAPRKNGVHKMALLLMVYTR